MATKPFRKGQRIRVRYHDGEIRAEVGRVENVTALDDGIRIDFVVVKPGIWTEKGERKTSDLTKGNDVADIVRRLPVKKRA